MPQIDKDKIKEEEVVKIDDDICDLLVEYGQDGHIDGHREITDYILELLSKTISQHNELLMKNIEERQKTIRLEQFTVDEIITLIKNSK